VSGFLVAEGGLNNGLVIRFEEGDEWVIGRDPDVSYQVLEDPMVSRKHLICRLTPEGYLLENLSVVNPVHVNGKKITESVVLQEGDAVQIGSSMFHFTLKDPALSEEGKDSPQEDVETPTIYEEPDDFGALSFHSAESSRWIIKVIAGPNAGAEFGIFENSTLVIGKDPKTCDILFQDLSVSSQHAKISANVEGDVIIEDLGSLNGIYINGQKISEPTKLNTQDLIALGTTSFLVMDQHQTRETLLSPLPNIDKLHGQAETEEGKTAEPKKKEPSSMNWKKIVIPMKHLVLAGVFAFFVVLAFGGMLSLFKSEKITIPEQDKTHEISKALSSFRDVEFSFNPSSGKIFILGHVITQIDHQELSYLLKSLPFIQSIEDNVVIDELVWGNTNALLMKNSEWHRVNLTSVVPGHFILRGYVQTAASFTKLTEYMNLNFPYLDKLDNQVVIEANLEAHVRSLLLEANCTDVTFQFSNGELILSGRAPLDKRSHFEHVVNNLNKIKGVKSLKSLVVFLKPTNETVDLSSKYKITGSSRYGTVSQYVVINGKILSHGDVLDGMTITNIEKNIIFLEKDGIKYKIQYNQP